MRVAVVGAGSIGREFATLHFGSATRTKVVSVIDKDEALARTLAADVGSVQAGASVVGSSGYRAVPDRVRGRPVPHFTELSKEALDACECVYVGVPPSSHAALVRQALRAGKHVILEKPLAASPEDADAIVEAAEAALETSGLCTSLNIGMRWNAALARMRQELSRGRAGKLTGGHLRLHFRTWPREWQRQKWVAERAEGGALREVGTHFLFGIHELFGHGAVRRVSAKVSYPDGPGGILAEESVDGVLELAPGSFDTVEPVQIAVSVRTTGQRDLLASGRDLYELEVRGSNGALRLVDFTSLTDERGRVLVDNAAYGRRECVTGLLAAVQGQPGAGAAGSTITAREARNAQRVLDGLLSSGGEWVEISYV